MQSKPEMVENNKAQQQLEVFIEDGGYAPGDRLPAERELIDRLGVSRSALRKGLDALEREGAIWRHVGKGTFIASRPEEGLFPDVITLSQRVTPVQMMRARLSLEPAIAREAAANASAECVQKIIAARDKAQSAPSWEDYEKFDDALHYAIADATGNVLLRSLFEHLNQVRRAVTWAQLIRQSDRPAITHASFAEHDDLVQAIEARDPGASHQAMRDHLNSVSARLFGEI